MIFVFDNFFSDPWEVRRIALKQEYHTEDFNYPGIRTHQVPLWVNNYIKSSLEYHIKENVNDSDNKIIIESDVIRIDNTDEWDRTRDFVRRKDTTDGIWKLYDRVNHTFEFPDDDYFYVNKVRLLLFEDIPTVFQRYITYKACGRAAVQLVSNANLQKMLQQYEVQARAACMEYECNQGDHNFMGWPDESAYQSFKPYTALRR